MKKLFILAVILFFTTSLYSQQDKAELEKLQKAKREMKTGTVLTLTGAATTVIGTSMFANGVGQKDPDTPGHINNDIHTSAGGVIGLGLMIA